MASLKVFTTLLMRWYKKNARDLSWRQTRDPYKIWVSEVMLQQTTVNTVIPYYQNWLRRFPDINSVASAPLQKVLKAWQGLGYYSRARNLHKAAKIIIRKFEGRVPEDPETLKGLPGFGDYTSGAVASIAYDKPAVIIDANVKRVVARLLAMTGPIQTRQEKLMKQFLSDRMPQRESGIFNQALMELGALVCRNKEPLCNICPVKEFCDAYAKGIQENIPSKKNKQLNDVSAVIGLIKNNHKYYLQKRPSSGLLANLWEFPGGKIERGETPLQALQRELLEETGAHLMKAKHFMNLKHFYTNNRVHLDVYDCEMGNTPKIDKSHKWIGLNQFLAYPMPSGSAKILDKILESTSK